MNDRQVEQFVEDKLQVFLGEFLRANDIPNGDIDPLTHLQFEQVQDDLVRVLEQWLRVAA